MRRLIVLTLVLAACGANVPVAGPGSTSDTPPLPAPTTTTSPTAAVVVPPTTVAGGVSETTVGPSDEAPGQPGEDVARPVPPTDQPGRTGEVSDDLLTPVLADAATRLGVSPDQLVVVRAEAVVWSDGSLGCPQPGQDYIQVLIPGYWVEVSFGERVLDYRLTEQGTFFLCEGYGQLGTPGSDS